MPITPTNPFKGRQFPGEVIILCVRWYLRYPLAYEQRRVVGGTRRGSGFQLHLAVGASLCSRTEQTLPPPSEGDQQKLPHRRGVYKGEGRGQTSVSSRGRNGANDRVPAHAKRNAAGAKRFLLERVT